jgi:hypothetical protein
VYRYDAGAYVLEATVGANVTAATLTGVPSTAAAQLFVVTVFNGSGESYSDAYVFSTVRSVPSGPVSPPVLGSASTTASSATVTWSDTANDELGYLVYRVVGSTQTLVPGCSIATPNLMSCTDSGLTPGEYYQYYVYAWNASGIGNAGTSIVVHTPRPLLAPTITDATGTTPTSVTLHWVDNAADETGYTVYEYVGGSYTPVATTGPDITEAVITGLSPATIHVYVVAANRGTELRYSTYGIWATTAAA